MTGWDMLFWSVAALWCLTATALILRLRRLQSLPALQKVERDHREKVSIIVAARDEQLRIENTVRTLLAQQHVALELIVVDDRSTDATPAILRDAAAAEPRLTVLRIDALPEGWLGKSNALQTGSKVATGEWILFTDADCWMRQDVVARVLQAAERERADHVCLLPSLAPAGKRRSVLLQACHLVFYSSLGKQMATVNGDSPRGFCGVGAFNFVRADLYRKFGGHEPLRLEVADDPMLGVLVRRSAGRTRAYLAAQHVECDWSQSVFGFV